MQPFRPPAQHRESAHSIVEAHEAFTRAEATRDFEMTPDEFWLLFHVLVHIAPAILANDAGEDVESGIIICRISADEPALEP
jgi:hypothetical protein